MRYIALLTTIAAAALGAAPAHAQPASAYPQKPIRLIVAFPPGSTTDIAARAIAGRSSEGLGQTIVIDNRSGASGQIGVELGARAAADGYTAVIGTTSTHALAPALNAKLGYDPRRDFIAVTSIGSSPYVLACHPSLAATAVNELIALARAKPGAIRYASAGNATLGHLAGELFAALAGIKLTHVPYKSSVLAAPDVLAGRIDMQFGSYAPTLPHLRSGKLRALAVTSASRTVTLPQIPTVQESGIPNYEVTLWMGVFLPARTPPAIVERLDSELSGAVKARDVAEVLANQGIEPESLSRAKFAERVSRELVKWKKVIAAVGPPAE